MLRFSVLGRVAIESDVGAVRGRAAHRRRLALLALLAAAPRAALQREKLIGYLWPEHSGDAARHLLSEALYVLRRELHGDLFATAGDEVALNTDVIACDLIAFREAVAAESWTRAVERYGGPLLDGFFVSEAPEFERWVETERVEVARDYARALEALALLSESAGEGAAAAEWWGRLASHDPYSSRVALRFMNALVAAGERARALHFAGSHTTLLRDELGLEPDAAIVELAERLRAEPPPPAPRPAAVATRAVEPLRRPAADAEAEHDLAQLLPDLEVIRTVGRGSVADVYVAREPALGRLVAVKILAPRLASDETTRLRFEREAQAAARLHHPNVATVFRTGRLGDATPYLVLPYIASGSLQDRMDASGPLGVPDVLRYTQQVAAALGAAHRLGIVHRDVRPANILYDHDTDRALLTDFGLAAVLESGFERTLKLTQPGQALGNPVYASPEQLLGESVTERADIYSLGVVMFELLTGQPPFAASTPLALIEAKVRGAPASAAALRADVGAELDDIITRCLNQRPEQRPFAADLVARLAQLQ